MEALPSEVQCLIAKVASDNNIKNFQVEFKNSVSKEGDGHIGIVEALYLKDKDNDEKLSLVFKIAPKSETLRKQFPTRNAFLREIYMYETVIPELLKFQAKHKISRPFNSVPQYYGSISTELLETIILDNLKEKSYRLCDRKIPLDPHHLCLVITTYARLHAISFAMRKLDPELFEKVTNPIREHVMKTHFGPKEMKNDASFTDEILMHIENAFFAPVLEALKEKPKELEAVKKLKDNFITFLYTEPTKETDYNVIGHTDCWSANILFKYQNESQVPSDICLIDWQLTFLTNPVCDISYFFFICAGKKDLYDYNTYLDLYYNTFCENVFEFGLDANNLYPDELFEEHWKKYAKAGFFMNVIMMQQSLTNKKTVDFDEPKNGENISDMSRRKVEISDLYRQRMGDLVEFLVEKKLI